jgi:hypothetical protein
MLYVHPEVSGFRAAGQHYAKAGRNDIMGQRKDGALGAFSGSENWKSHPYPMKFNRS